MRDVPGITASEAQHIVDPHLGVEVRDNGMSHSRRLVERHRDRKAMVGAACPEYRPCPHHCAEFLLGLEAFFIRAPSTPVFSRGLRGP